MNGFRKFITQGSKLLLGLVFFIAGVLKLMDPVGTSLIVTEYFNFFHLSFLKVLSTPFGVILALLETAVGAGLLTGVFRKVTAFACALLIGAFTMITFILWIFNPPMDCGCFGEAFHLTHAQSFLKNIVLLLLALAAFRPYRMYKPTRKVKYVLFSIVMVSVAVFSVYSLLYIPLVDFTPFNSSSMLAAAVTEEPQEEYVSTFIYEKNGQQGVFTLDRLPDSTWTFVETRTVRKEDQISETDYPVLSFRNPEGEYCDALAAEGNVLIVSAYKPEKLNDEKLIRTAQLLAQADSSGFTPLFLLAADPASFRQVLATSGLSAGQQEQLSDHLYFSDYKTLITLNRSNGGAVYYNDGNMIQKWASRALPSESDLHRFIRKDSTELMLSASTKGMLWFQGFMLYALGIMLIF